MTSHTSNEPVIPWWAGGLGIGLVLIAAEEGKLDAWATVAGGLVGALVFAFVFHEMEEHLLSVGRFGGVTLQGLLGISGIWIAAPLAIGCFYLAMRLPNPGGAP